MRRSRAAGLAACLLVIACAAGCSDANARPSDAGSRAPTAATAPRNVPSSEGSAPTSTEAKRPSESMGETPAPFALRPAPWGDALEALIGGRPASVSVAIDGRLRFSHLGEVPRAPASNQKLLLSMALLDRFGPRSRIATAVAIEHPVRDGVVRGDAWIVGDGDPAVNDSTIERLADAIAHDGVRRVTGSIVGDTSAFRRDRWAPGWHRIALSYVSVPTALTFDANADASGFVLDPERRAAAAMTDDLRQDGVAVEGRPGDGRVPRDAMVVERVRSAPLVELLRDQNVGSVNLDAEVLGKRLGAVAFRTRASIADGAQAIERWAADRGVRVVARDASGLSYANRITTDGMVRLLSLAEREPWGDALRSTLARPGVGTLGGRLAGLDVRAKTGTLIGGISALSGWVRRPDGRWAAFSILSSGMAKADAVALEDAVVRFLAGRS